MGETAGEAQSAALSGRAGRRFARRWGLLFAALLLAFLGTVITLNLTLYSAQGFVGGYLSALARHDIAGALAPPGVTVPDGADRRVLTADGLGELGDIRSLSTTSTSTADDADGTVTVEYGFTLDGKPATSTFSVEAQRPLLGIFSTWSFAASPTATLTVTPLGDAGFTANGVAVTALGPSEPVALAVLAPAAVGLAHDSAYLLATPRTSLVADPGAQASAELPIAANPAFVDLVQKQLTGLLDDCTTQTVLQPTGCPFGEAIRNRIDDVPVWSMVDYPQVMIVPGETPGTWQVPETAGAAHLVVGVQSLFDGTRSVFDEDVPFTVSYLLTFSGDGSVTITAQ
ncbi:MAG: hypothetical protein H7146_10740 [Burkholderiaceae bacterium]|nr:hypothetical protein [Microbacteriaceae bacterium]